MNKIKVKIIQIICIEISKNWIVVVIEIKNAKLLPMSIHQYYGESGFSPLSLPTTTLTVT